MAKNTARICSQHFSKTIILPGPVFLGKLSSELVDKVNVCLQTSHFTGATFK